MSTEVKIRRRNAILNYFEESVQELRKVTWPTRNQAVRLTFLVLGFCIAAAIIIGALDFVFSYGHQKLVELAPAGTPINIDDFSATPADAGTPVGNVTVNAGGEETGGPEPVATETAPSGTQQ